MASPRSPRMPRVRRHEGIEPGLIGMVSESFVVVPDDREERPWGLGHMWVGKLNWAPAKAVCYWCWRKGPLDMYIPDVLEQLMCEPCLEILVARGEPQWYPNNVQRAWPSSQNCCGALGLLISLKFFRPSLRSFLLTLWSHSRQEPHAALPALATGSYTICIGLPVGSNS